VVPQHDKRKRKLLKKTMPHDEIVTSDEENDIQSLLNDFRLLINQYL